MSSLPTSDELNAAIAAAATSPQRVTVDGTSTEARDVDQIVKAANHVAAANAKASATRGFTFLQKVNGGAA
jgi:hypothetical protein